MKKVIKLTQEEWLPIVCRAYKLDYKKLDFWFVRNFFNQGELTIELKEKSS